MKYKWVWLVVILGIVLRLLSLDNAISYDEYMQAKAVSMHQFGLTTWTFSAFYSLFGTDWSLRLVSLVFFCLTLLVLYLLGKEMYDRKTALWAVALLSLSPLSLFDSVAISFVSLFVFYSLFSFYCYLRYSKGAGVKWIVLTAVSLLLGILTTKTAVFALLAVCAYALVLKRFKDLWLLVIALALFFSNSGFLFPNVLFAGPLLLFGYLLYFRRFSSKDLLLHFGLLSAFLPSLCLLVGKYFSSLKFDRKHFALAFFGTGICLFFWYVVAGIPHSNSLLDWNHLMPLTNLYAPFLVIAFAFIFCLVSFVFAVFKKTGAVVLLAFGLSFSLFLMVEMSLHPLTPDVSAVVKETSAFVVNSSLPSPYYVYQDYAIRHYLDKGTTTFYANSNVSYVRSKLQKHGTLIVIDYPALDKDSSLWKNFTSCRQLTNVSSKGITIGYVFRC